MIARTWSGTVRRADAETYANYIRETGFAEYGHTPGNRGAWMLRRDEGERTEFITLSLWESENAIRAFAACRPPCGSLGAENRIETAETLGRP